jgi:hypothetical protein
MGKAGLQTVGEVFEEGTQVGVRFRSPFGQAAGRSACPDMVVQIRVDQPPLLFPQLAYLLLVASAIFTVRDNWSEKTKPKEAIAQSSPQWVPNL